MASCSVLARVHQVSFEGKVCRAFIDPSKSVEESNHDVASTLSGSAAFCSAKVLKSLHRLLRFFCHYVMRKFRYAEDAPAAPRINMTHQLEIVSAFPHRLAGCYTAYQSRGSASCYPAAAEREQRADWLVTSIGLAPDVPMKNRLLFSAHT